MIDTKKIIWLAGLLEGEGCFTFNPSKNRKYLYPQISIAMKDRDIIYKAHRIMNGIYFSVRDYRYKNYKMYKSSVNGNLAVQWMMTLYTLMGERRKARIKEILNYWKTTEYPGKGSNIKSFRFNMIMKIQKINKVTRTEAKSMYIRGVRV